MSMPVADVFTDCFYLELLLSSFTDVSALSESVTAVEMKDKDSLKNKTTKKPCYFSEKIRFGFKHENLEKMMKLKVFF